MSFLDQNPIIPSQKTSKKSKISHSNPNINPLSIIPLISPTEKPSLFAESHRLANPSKRRKKTRPADIVRVPSLPSPDRLYFRGLVRRRLATFESLRIQITHKDSSNRRADLKAGSLMIDRGLGLYRDKRIIGSIPGILVGDIYFYRIELCVIGLHGQVQAGIDIVPASQSGNGEPIATSIIVSGGYEDDDDKGDVLIYSGHGGRDRNLVKMCGGQRLEGGNLGLERSMSYGVEIRVIRGLKFEQSPTGRLYVYDGLYKVVDCWMDGGKSGFGVYKYRLVRIEGQEEKGSDVVKMSLRLKICPLSVRKSGLFCDDISMGKERVPVSLYNDLDDDRDPLKFEYLVRPVYPVDVKGKFFGGCECTKSCCDDCYCARLNGGEFAFDGSGVLLRGKPLIYECGVGCRCPQSCPNRVSQKGIGHQLEVFRSNETGWGVRSKDLIRAGSFICEFSGIVLTKQQTELLSRVGQSLVYPNRFPERWAEWGDLSDVFSDNLMPRYPFLPELSFSIDVSRARNIACYLSHSCSPNVFLQFVLYDHYNASFPHLMIFAMENIPPLRELSIDYGVVKESVGKLTL